jgi:hypothetical protein
MASVNVLIWDTSGGQDDPAAILTLTHNTFSDNTWTSDTAGVLAADSGTWTSITLHPSNAVRLKLLDSNSIEIAHLDGAQSPLDGSASGTGLNEGNSGNIGATAMGAFSWQTAS